MRTHQETTRQKNLILLERAFAALKNTTGITGQVVATEPSNDEEITADATIALDVAGTLYRYRVGIKRIDRFAAIGQIKNQLDSFQQPGLFVAPRITPEAADKCRELNVQFLDTNGNTFLKAPGLFVFVKGQRPRTNEEIAIAVNETPRGGTATALRVIFALLSQPKLVNAPYREINQAAGVALGNVGAVFNDLNERGYTTGGQKKGERRILERKRLIDEWVTHYPIKLRPKLNRQRFHAADPNWWRHADITQYGAQWGGEVAADTLTGQLRPNSVTIYMRPEGLRANLTKMVVEHKLRAASDGEIEVLESFWDLPLDAVMSNIVPPVLVYADLLATLDPRNFEVGRMIYEERVRGPNTKD